MVKEEDYLLTNQEILGGLKAALERGQNLKQAMMSFYQAGYKKEEIEDAARAYLYLQRGNSEAEVLSKKQPPQIKGAENKESEKKPEAKPGGLFGKKKEEEKEKPKTGLPGKEGEIKKEKHKFSLFGKKKEDEKKFSEVGKTKVPEMGENNQKKEENKKIVQKISGYDNPGKKEMGKFKSKAVTSILVITLIVLVVILALVFLFKDELVNFVNGLFG